MFFHPVPPNIANDVCRWYGAPGISINDFRLNPFDCALTSLYCTVQYCTALYCNVLYFTFCIKVLKVVIFGIVILANMK